MGLAWGGMGGRAFKRSHRHLQKAWKILACMWRVKGHYWAGCDAKEACHFNNRPAERLQALLPGGSVMMSSRLYRRVLEHTATFSQANLSKTPIVGHPPQVSPITSHRYLSYRASYTVHGGGAGGFVCDGLSLCAWCVIKASHRGLQGWATPEKQRILGCHSLIFTQFRAGVWGPHSLTAFGQHSDKWKSAVARVPRVGQVQVENPPTTPSSISLFH